MIIEKMMVTIGKSIERSSHVALDFHIFAKYNAKSIYFLIIIMTIKINSHLVKTWCCHNCGHRVNWFIAIHIKRQKQKSRFCGDSFWAVDLITNKSITQIQQQQ